MKNCSSFLGFNRSLPPKIDAPRRKKLVWRKRKRRKYPWVRKKQREQPRPRQYDEKPLPEYGGRPNKQSQLKPQQQYHKKPPPPKRYHAKETQKYYPVDGRTEVLLAASASMAGLFGFSVSALAFYALAATDAVYTASSTSTNTTSNTTSTSTVDEVTVFQFSPNINLSGSTIGLTATNDDTVTSTFTDTDTNNNNNGLVDNDQIETGVSTVPITVTSDGEKILLYFWHKSTEIQNFLPCLGQKEI